jgi:hypothetical protein
MVGKLRESKKITGFEQGREYGKEPERALKTISSHLLSFIVFLPHLWLALKYKHSCIFLCNTPFFLLLPKYL